MRTFEGTVEVNGRRYNYAATEYDDERQGVEVTGLEPENGDYRGLFDDEERIESVNDAAENDAYERVHYLDGYDKIEKLETVDKYLSRMAGEEK